MTDRLELLADIAFKLAEARETDEIYDILAASDIRDAEEMTVCLATAVIINGKKLDEVMELFGSINEPIEEATSLQEDETLLN